MFPRVVLIQEHLRYNFYPPLVQLVPADIEADLKEYEEGRKELSSASRVLKNGREMSIGEMIDELRLEQLVEWREEDLQ